MTLSEYQAHDARERRRWWIALWVIWFVGVVALVSFGWLFPAMAHTAPSGEFVYPPGCCHSAATNPNGDCAPIPDGTVTATPTGWKISLKPGQHPKLKKNSYTAIVPYGDAKVSDDGEFHVCLAHEGSVRFCFFAPPPAG